VKLLAAMERNLEEHVAYVQRQTAGMLVEDADDLLLVDSGLPTDTFNKILRTRLTAGDADRRIAAAIRHFRVAGRPFAWWVTPSTRPPDLERRLVKHGLRAEERELGMVCELSSLPTAVEVPAGLEIRQVRSGAELEGFARVMSECWEPPDAAVLEFFRRSVPLVLRPESSMKFFIGHLDGEPVGGAELFVGAGVAGIHMVATRHQFQRRGIGVALTWTAAGTGRRIGLRHATLQASEQGVRTYKKLGFVPLGNFVEYR
jgi:GNAT superfamily N-acetyltransferase